jgi:hypothetical protein
MKQDEQNKKERKGNTRSCRAYTLTLGHFSSVFRSFSPHIFLLFSHKLFADDGARKDACNKILEGIRVACLAVCGGANLDNHGEASAKAVLEMLRRTQAAELAVDLRVSLAD